MASTVYSGPRGEYVLNPTDPIIDDLLSQGEGYWQDLRGCGLGTFDFIVDEYHVANLETTFAKGLGYYLALTHLDPQGHRTFIAVNDEDGNEGVVELHYGGEPFLVPRQLFHPAATAAAVVKEFCKTGERNAAVNWYPLKELNWDSTTGEWSRPRPR